MVHDLLRHLMCKREESLCCHLEIEIAQIGHGVIVLLISTQLIQLNRLVVVLDCLSETLFEAEAQIVLRTGTVTRLPEKINSLFVFLRMIEIERT